MGRATHPRREETIVRLDESPATLRVQRRLIEADGSIYSAFDTLECGVEHEQAIEFLRIAMRGVPEEVHGGLIGAFLGFGMICVESDRQRPSRLVVTR